MLLVCCASSGVCCFGAHVDVGSSKVLGYSGCLPLALCSQVGFPLPPFWGEDGDHPLEGICPFGMATISNDIVQRVNRFRKQTCNKHTDRGGGKQKATGKVPVDARRRLST